MNCRLQDEVQSMCEGAEAWCAGNRKFWAAAVGQKRSITSEQGKAAIKNTQPPISTKCPSDFEQTEAINCPPQQP